jgi:hypothetical protein
MHPGRLFLQSLWVQFSRVRAGSFDKEASLKLAQKQTARENPRWIGRIYSGRESQVKVNQPENEPNLRDLEAKSAIRRLLFAPCQPPPMKPTGSLLVVA